MAPCEMLRRDMRAKRISGRRLAAAIGCSASFVSLLLAAKKRPGLALAARIEEFTGIPAKAWVTEAPASDPATPAESGPAVREVAA